MERIDENASIRLDLIYSETQMRRSREISRYPPHRDPIRALTLTGSDSLEVQNDVVIGRAGESGTLDLFETGLSVGGEFSVDNGSSIQFSLSDSFPSSGSSCIETLQSPAIGGSISVDLGLIDQDSLAAGDEIVLLRSSGTPIEGQDRFDLVLLPALAMILHSRSTID